VVVIILRGAKLQFFCELAILVLRHGFFGVWLGWGMSGQLRIFAAGICF
jgi:hypothetical protein